MFAPTLEGFTETEATAIITALRGLGYRFLEESEQEVLNGALTTPGGVAVCYDKNGGYGHILVRPPVSDHSGEFGVRLYHAPHGYNALLQPQVAQQFKRVPPEFSSDSLEIVYLSDGACFVFNGDCAPGHVFLTVHWGLQEIEVGELVATRFISHDHGSHRDGECPACEALVQGGESIKCFECNGSGEARMPGHIACWRCGGNFNLVRIIT